jgi:hypothetical protein
MLKLSTGATTSRAARRATGQLATTDLVVHGAGVVGVVAVGRVGPGTEVDVELVPAVVVTGRTVVAVPDFSGLVAQLPAASPTRAASATAAAGSVPGLRLVTARRH